jgi:molecular chaperone GrpE
VNEPHHPETDHPSRPSDEEVEAAVRTADVPPPPEGDGPAEAPDDGDGREGDGREGDDGDGVERDRVDLESIAETDPRSKAELVGALLDLEADRDEYLDDLRRARAEFDNYRRRVTREAASQRRAGAAEAVTALLDVLDDLDRTLEAAQTSSDDGLAKGVELVASKLVESLRSLGVERIDAEGEPFDPTQHEAVQQLPGGSDQDGPVVAKVLRPGYRLDDRVLRPAMVVVEG